MCCEGEKDERQYMFYTYNNVDKSLLLFSCYFHNCCSVGLFVFIYLFFDNFGSIFLFTGGFI